jgi:low temperature requirement protein LtrA
MPSLHFAWAAWVAWALWPTVKDRLTRTMVVAYPCATLVAVVVTANHFVADVVAGGLTLATAVALVAVVSSGSIRWRSRQRVSV